MSSAVPADWERVKLSDVAEVVSGGAAPQGNHFFGGDRRFVRVKHLEGGQEWVDESDFITEEAVAEHKLRLFPAGTIVFPKSGASIRLEKRARLSSDSYAVSHLCAVLPHADQADPDFLFRVLQTIRFAEGKADGYPTLKISDIRTTPLVLPPIQTQRAIADALELIQKARMATDRVFRATTGLRRSLSDHLFTYGATPLKDSPGIKLTETPVGTVPKHWKVVPVSSVVSPAAKSDPTKNPTRSFQYVDVSSVSRDALRIVNTTEHTGETAPGRARKEIRQGDVIFATVRPRLRRIAPVPPELDGEIASTAFCVLRANGDDVTSEYLFYAASRSDFVDRVSNHQHGSSYPAVTDKHILAEKIPLPPREEQVEIARVLGAADQKIFAEQGRIESIQSVFSSVLPELVSGERAVEGVGVGSG